MQDGPFEVLQWNWKIQGLNLSDSKVIEPLIDYYKLPPDTVEYSAIPTDPRSDGIGFFKFGEPNICYGRSGIGVSLDPEGSVRFDAFPAARQLGASLQLTFDFAEVVENLRRERYRQSNSRGNNPYAPGAFVYDVYYFLRRFLPFTVRRYLQRTYFRDWKKIPFPAWPVDFTVDRLHEEILRLCMQISGLEEIPFIWFWPEGAPNCLIITHDVETAAGRDFAFELLKLDESYGFKGAYQVVPERRYEISEGYMSSIRDRGCEVNVHDLNHDGRLYKERSEFDRRALLINRYLHRYQSEGFRAGAMYRMQDWYEAFECKYDMSVPNVAHLEPMRGGCCTVMPYFIGEILEIPLTTAQDYSLFHILRDYTTELWKRQIALIKERSGLISFLTHPDYLVGQRERSVYESLLDYLKHMVAVEKTWATLPGDVNHWWRARSRMQLVQREGVWQIEGPEKERARLAFARLKDGHLAYQLA